MPPVILHADMDAFYASVEQRDDPRLKGRPVIVGGLGRRGVVCAASYEARRYGVRSAMPTAQARRLCPAGVYLPPRMSHYASIAADVREVFDRFTPLVEPLSLDEAYLDVTASLRLFGGAEAIAAKLRAEVRSGLDLAVSVGGGPGKLVAKIASARAKPDGMLLVDDARGFLAPLRVGEIWGVGPATEARLHGLGIATIGQLAAFDAARLERELGSFGPTLHALARGEDLRTVEVDRGRSSCGEENTFPEDVSDPDLLEAMILAHAETVARRLRREGMRARTVSLKWRASGEGVEWKLLVRSRTLDEPTDDGPAIAAAATALWREAGEKRPLRLIGVQASNLGGAGATQLGLFPSAEDRRRRDLNRALDDLVERFGKAAVRRADVPVD